LQAKLSLYIIDKPMYMYLKMKDIILGICISAKKVVTIFKFHPKLRTTAIHKIDPRPHAVRRLPQLLPPVRGRQVRRQRPQPVRRGRGWRQRPLQRPRHGRNAFAAADEDELGLRLFQVRGQLLNEGCQIFLGPKHTKTG
jgi:hypothetical protein